MARLKKKRTIVIAAMVVVLAVAGVLVVKQYSKKPQIQVLDTAKAEFAPVKEVLVETGMIKLQVGAQVKIGARATGTITKMHVRIGDKVTAGQYIAKIDDRDNKKEILKLTALLDKAKNNVKQIENTYPLKIKEAQNDLAANTAKLKLDSVEFTRRKDLVAKGYIAQSDFDKVQSDYEQTSALNAVKKDTVRRLKEEFTTTLKMARDDADNALFSLEKEKIQLSYTDIISPINGIVSEVAAQEGETVVTGLQVANLITVIVPGKLEMWVYVDETDIGKVRKELKVQYSVDTYPDKTFTGIIDRINPQSIVKDNIVYYIAVVNMTAEDALLLRPDMTAHVRIESEGKDKVLTVPNGAVKFDEGKQVVYVVDGSGKKTRKKTVKTGIRGEERTEILSGLNPGDTVATRLVLPVDMGKIKKGGGGGH